MAFRYSCIFSVLISTGFILGNSFAWADTSGSLSGVSDDLPGTLPNNIGTGVMGLSDNGNVLAGTIRLDAFNYRAYRFDAAGKTELTGTNGYQKVIAQSASSDGSIIVGYELPTYVSASAHALIWNNGTLTVLPDLNTAPSQYSPASSYAYAVSNDGSVVAGHSLTSGGAFHAVRWINGGTPQDLNGGGFNNSFTSDTDNTGATVVGYGATTKHIEEAFHWTSNDGMIGLGVLANHTGTGSRSRASGVSGDGSVIAGWSESPTSQIEAFRWTSQNGMVGLGLLTGGTYSKANDINNDGTVIVGNADKPVVINNVQQNFTGGTGFRWQSGIGMQSIADWLSTNGVTIGSNTFSDAVAVNASGNVVVGTGQINNKTQIYIARVNEGGGSGGDDTGGGNTEAGNTGDGNTGGLNNGVIGVNDFTNSLTIWKQNLQAISQRYGLTLWGSHHRNLMDSGLADQNGTGIWATGDYARQHDNDSRARQGLGEVGIFHDFSSNLRIGLGLGTNDVRHHMDLGSKTSADGTYAVGEIDFAPSEERNLVFSVTGLYGKMDSKINRGYLNGASLDSSSGKTDANTSALRLRLDRHQLLQLGAFSLSPFISYSYSRTKLDSYTEVGGGFPVAYDDQKLSTNEFRLGITAKTAIANNSDLRVTGELVSAKTKIDAVNVQLLGINGFSFAASNHHATWGRLGLELDHRFSKRSVISASAYAASEGNDADYSASISWKQMF